MDTSKLNPSKSYLVAGKTLSELQKDIDDLRGGKNIQRGPGIYLRKAGSSGFAIASKTSEASLVIPSVALPTPFLVTKIALPDFLYKAWVNLESDLLKSLKLTDKQTITGLGGPGDTPPGTPFNLDGNDLIWLKVSFSDNGVISGATIESYGLGNQFDVNADPGATGTNAYIEYDVIPDPTGGTNTTYKQSFARFPICQAIADANGAPVLRQMLTQNLLMTWITLDDGKVVWYPLPYGGRSYQSPATP